MVHIRTTIRQAFVDTLKGHTAAGDKVYDSRMYNIDESSLPSIIIFSNNEEILTSTMGLPRLQNRTLKITVECYGKATNQVKKLMDDLTLEVEQLIYSNEALKKLCKDCKLESTDMQLNSNADKPVAVASLVFSVLYLTKEDNPTINI
jgi:hypothetical protein